MMVSSRVAEEYRDINDDLADTLEMAESDRYDVWLHSIRRYVP